MKNQLLSKLLWKYENLLKEIVAQKANYTSELEFQKSFIKYAHIVNYLHGVKFRSL